MTETTYSHGDLVEAVRDDTVIRGRASASFGKHLLGLSGRIMEELEENGFTLTVIEKAAPKNVLPTEAGVYADREGDFLIVYEDGDVQSVEVAKEGQSVKRRPIAADSDFAPFTRVEPVPVTAKKVLDALWELNDPAHSVVDTAEKTAVLTLRDLLQIANDYGVELHS